MALELLLVSGPSFWRAHTEVRLSQTISRYRDLTAVVQSPVGLRKRLLAGDLRDGSAQALSLALGLRESPKPRLPSGEPAAGGGTAPGEAARRERPATHHPTARGRGVASATASRHLLLPLALFKQFPLSLTPGGLSLSSSWDDRFGASQGPGC